MKKESEMKDETKNEHNDEERVEEEGFLTKRRTLLIVVVCLAIILIFGWRIISSGVLGNGGLDYTPVSDSSSDEEEFASYKMYVLEDCLVTDTIDPDEADYKISLTYDDEVTVVGVEDDYYLIIAGDGRKAYIKQELLTAQKPKEVDPDQTHWEHKSKGLSIEIDKYTENDGASSEDIIVYWVANVKMKNPNQMFQTVLAGGDYESSTETKERCSEMAESVDAIFAVNGDACGFRGNGSEYEDPILIRNGVLYHEDDRDIGKMLAIYKSGTMKLFRPGELGSGEHMVSEGVTDTFWFDTALVENGEVISSLISSESNFDRAPYTAIGQVDNNHYVFICVDGRGSNDSIGVTYTGMARLMQKYGCETAYELDGGGSTTMYFDGMVLNEPSDGRQRSISDAICIIPKEDNSTESSANSDN
ncbi:MAG: phosphodiester glycosidase family protein [Eubacterium sp.]|nr:phosphodiester glycosidase family protein [Eubacterium sp.]